MYNIYRVPDISGRRVDMKIGRFFTFRSFCEWAYALLFASICCAILLEIKILIFGILWMYKVPDSTGEALNKIALTIIFCFGIWGVVKFHRLIIAEESQHPNVLMFSTVMLLGCLAWIISGIFFPSLMGIRLTCVALVAFFIGLVPMLALCGRPAPRISSSQWKF